ncbi:MAG TPA: hypothetical protein VMZ27_02655 [Candidatus Saccharimonadales bacterium]|nr:hypothetical protein [Candidatus Saccharimonadales bacterium]
MKVVVSEPAIEALKDVPRAVKKAFDKQLRFLVLDLRHPSLRAKKYNEKENKWQARVNDAWRFYFKIVGNTYIIQDVIPHPK